MTHYPSSLLAVLYVVRCRFSGRAESIAQEWLAWLRDRHLREVLAAGALSAEVFRTQGTDEQYEIHYRFGSLEDFARYEEFQAPRLRADGLQRFPLALGLQYERGVYQRQFALDSSELSAD